MRCMLSVVEVAVGIICRFVIFGKYLSYKGNCAQFSSSIIITGF